MCASVLYIRLLPKSVIFWSIFAFWVWENFFTAIIDKNIKQCSIIVPLISSFVFVKALPDIDYETMSVSSHVFYLYRVPRYHVFGCIPFLYLCPKFCYQRYLLATSLKFDNLRERSLAREIQNLLNKQILQE